ncbi:DNA cytosine methyltransferase [Pseudomonas sp. LS44]|uniref:DNA cytosine methyltransferase n=1 Tax=Pseudomonas sp. LS44 TaxID=1357074 RepID=UPI00215B5B04|nr:DNA cytosine methyltransferase [Pseudomonas sp. LS44]UVE19413.1 DNA cytosine methyltransferase [Pseudomonas sp. LS44]
MNRNQMTFLPEDTPLDPQGELSQPIQIVDLFAGPGGLGEGFSSFGDGKRFEIVVSAEKDSKAWQTLRLRAFFRLLKKHKPSHLFEYYDYCNDPSAKEGFIPSDETKGLWEAAAREAKCITLGSDEGNKELDDALNDQEHGLDRNRPWVLIGGPPCQAYSVVGRARNQAKADYKAEEDHRHFLYKEYLRIIRERQPTVFVMENVKGILSSKVNNERIFSNILRDLSGPHKSPDEGGAEKRYHIYSLVTGTHFAPDDDVDKINPKSFIIRAEDYGIPQARHRVILLGISEDCLPADIAQLKLAKDSPEATVGQVIGSLPKLRSGLTKMADSQELWASTVQEQVNYLRDQIDVADKMWLALGDVLRDFNAPASWGGRRIRRAASKDDGSTGSAQLDDWYHDEHLDYWLNHEARGHMLTDLRRYVFAATYAKLHGVSPKGHKGFNLKGLAPDHSNWESGVFSDRFRVQAEHLPATTITSHISKDGHYFIHYDPTQCRSLSVREAARIQTFPDNYFFQGNRTEQFHQVGNAVPPLLASKIAGVVFRILFDKVQEFDEQGSVVEQTDADLPWQTQNGAQKARRDSHRDARSEPAKHTEPCN